MTPTAVSIGKAQCRQAQALYLGINEAHRIIQGYVGHSHFSEPSDLRHISSVMVGEPRTEIKHAGSCMRWLGSPGRSIHFRKSDLVSDGRYISKVFASDSTRLPQAATVMGATTVAAGSTSAASASAKSASVTLPPTTSGSRNFSRVNRRKCAASGCPPRTI